jgi:adenylate cyclase
LHSHDRTIRELLAHHGGSEVKQRGGGDGFFAVFTNPSNAIDCAVAIQRCFAEHRDAHGFAPELRIGVHETDALLSGNDFAGVGVHEAARIAAYADGGSILASQATAAAAGARTNTPARHRTPPLVDALASTPRPDAKNP